MSVSVCVTGMGVVCALGRGVEAFFDGLVRGESALAPLEGIPIARGKHLGAQLKDPPLGDPNRVGTIARAAVSEAIAMAGWNAADLHECGLFAGTVGYDSQAAEARFRELVDGDAASGDLAEALLRYANGGLADELSQAFGVRGPRDVNTNACASGNVAIARAMMAIRQGRVRRAIVCGADQLRPTQYWMAERAGLTGHDLRPFHRNRGGTVFGDGAGALALESEEVARARGARCYSRLAGWSVVCDEDPQYILPQLDGGAALRAFREALDDGGLAVDTVDYVNAHGTGTINIDRIEAIACQRLFGARAPSVAVNSTKSLTGHLSGASAVVEAIATVLAISRGYVHATAKLDDPDPELQLDFVPLEGRRMSVRGALSNSMGGGGTNAAVAICDPQLPARAPTAVGCDAVDCDGDDVVITGTGAVSVFGEGVDALREGLFGRRARPRGGLCAEFDVRHHAGADSRYEHLSRAAQLAFVGGGLALDDAKLTPGRVAGPRIAVVLGTAFGGSTQWAHVTCDAYSRDPRLITPNMALEHGHHLGVTLIARRCGALGVTCTLTGGWTAGLDAIAFGADLLRADRCDVAVVGGVDAFDPLLDRALTLLGCSQRAATGAAAPYAAAATGFTPAEGAACLVLERRRAAERRGARAQGTLRGFGSSGEPVGVGRYDASGAALSRAMETALGDRSGPEEVCVLGGGNGTSALDAADRRAVEATFRTAGLTPRLLSVHGLLGETFGAAGALSTVAALCIASEGAVPRWGERANEGHFAIAGAPLEARNFLVLRASPGGSAAALELEVAHGS